MKQTFLLLLFSCLFSVFSFAQVVEITGIVADETTNQPMEGVTVTAAGAETLTDAAGNFTLKPRLRGGDLVVSFYKTGFLAFEKAVELKSHQTKVDIGTIKISQEPSAKDFVTDEDRIPIITLAGGDDDSDPDHKHNGHHHREGPSPIDNLKPMAFNEIYHIPESHALVGDRSDRYAKLRKHYDHLLPKDLERSMEFVQSIREEQAANDYNVVPIVQYQSHGSLHQGHDHHRHHSHRHMQEEEENNVLFEYLEHSFQWLDNNDQINNFHILLKYYQILF